MQAQRQSHLDSQGHEHSDIQTTMAPLQKKTPNFLNSIIGVIYGHFCVEFVESSQCITSCNGRDTGAKLRKAGTHIGGPQNQRLQALSTGCRLFCTPCLVALPCCSKRLGSLKSSFVVCSHKRLLFALFLSGLYKGCIIIGGGKL